jgi:transposase-like protein
MYHTAVTIESLPEAFLMMKHMQAEGLEWADGYRPLGRQAIAKIIESRMAEAVDAHLERMAQLEVADRRNGSYNRWLLTELGDIELSVPRTRNFNPKAIIRAYARRSGEVDRMILACFVLGLSTRKVAEALLPVLGRPVSPGVVSEVAKTLDAAVAAFHRRPLVGRYTALMLDGVVLSRKTGAGAIKRPVLVALGIHPDGRKEIIDYRLAASESAAEWERFLTDLYKRGLTGDGLDMICVDGGKGMLAALPIVFPHLPVQRCWAHKMRNLVGAVREKDQAQVKKGLHAVMNAANEKSARSAARNLADTWQATYPKMVASLRNDLDDLLTCFRYKTLDERKKVRTTNAVERRFREVRRRTRPMGVFQDKTSMDRILFAVFLRENKSQGANQPFLLTQNN